MSSKPPNVCWCDCHTPVDDGGRRIFVNVWPEYDAPVALITACVRCTSIHKAFVYGGADAARAELHRLAAAALKATEDEG